MEWEVAAEDCMICPFRFGVLCCWRDKFQSCSMIILTVFLLFRMIDLAALLDGFDVDSFWAKVDVRGLDECWNWKLSTRKGYGRIKRKGKTLVATRVAYYLCYGLDPGDKYVCHICDNPSCVNPSHFFLGSNQENQLDASRKGRSKGNYSGAKLSPKQVKEAFTLHQKCVPQNEIARRTNVSRAAINALVKGITWGNLTGASPDTYVNTRAKSRFRGVALHGGSNTNPWMANICVSNNKMYLGLFSSEKEAAIAYDIAARGLIGQSAITNFPDSEQRFFPDIVSKVEIKLAKKLSKRLLSDSYG